MSGIKKVIKVPGDDIENYIKFIQSPDYKHHCGAHGYVKLYLTEEILGGIISHCEICLRESNQKIISDMTREHGE